MKESEEKKESGNNANGLLQVRNLVKHYPVRGGVFSRKLASVKAVQDVSFVLHEGETLGLVGESGCGKSTLARTVIRLEDPTSGSVLFKGRDLAKLNSKELFSVRRDIQMIFQDPYSSLNPRMTVGDIVMDPLKVHRMGNRKQREEKAADLLERVGLSADLTSRYPHEFSGGQRQRIGVARALSLEPKVIIADEPVSALDVSVQSQVLNLLMSLQMDFGLTYLFITHDLSVVKHICDRIAVMYLGRIVEQGSAEEIFKKSRHPYTRFLMEAAPAPDPKKMRIKRLIRGETPSPITPPPGCAFHPRCPYAIPECKKGVPPLAGVDSEKSSEHLCACIRKNEI